MTTTPRTPDPAQMQPRRRAFLEDVEWMAETGETMPGAAARLRIHPQTLRQNLDRAGRRDLWARLIANADLAYPVTGRIRHAA
jgi:hypothetical protein